MRRLGDATANSGWAHGVGPVLRALTVGGARSVFQAVSLEPWHQHCVSADIAAILVRDDAMDRR
jgi:hypothetical protein